MRRGLEIKALVLLVGMLGALTAWRAEEVSLDNVGLSEMTIWQISQPSRENLDNADKCRGSFLRTEVKKGNLVKKLKICLVLSKATGQPSFQLLMQDEQEVIETRVYEALIRKAVNNENRGPGSYEYRLLPGECVYGEESVRTVQLPPKPLANTSVRINAMEFVTDEEGIVQDSDMRLRILDSLDTLRRRTMDFIVEVPGMPSQLYTVFRTMPQRRDYDEKLLDEPAEQDILQCYHLNFRQSLMQPEQNELECSVESEQISGLLRTGEWFPITVVVANHGTRQTSCLLGRTFSRIPGLNGKLFYFGAIAPGSTARFTRYFKIAPEELVNQAFVEVRFSDSWSTLKQRIPFDLRFVH